MYLSKRFRKVANQFHTRLTDQRLKTYGLCVSLKVVGEVTNVDEVRGKGSIVVWKVPFPRCTALRQKLHNAITHSHKQINNKPSPPPRKTDRCYRWSQDGKVWTVSVSNNIKWQELIFILLEKLALTLVWNKDRFFFGGVGVGLFQSCQKAIIAHSPISFTSHFKMTVSVKGIALLKHVFQVKSPPPTPHKQGLISGFNIRTSEIFLFYVCKACTA